MIIPSTHENIKLVYQAPKLEKYSQWQPLVQSLSLPIGIGNVETDAFAFEGFYELYK